MKRKLTILTTAVLILLSGFAVSASANSIYTAGGPWIAPMVGGSGTASAPFVEVRLSIWEFPPPPTWPGQPREWIPITTHTVPTNPNGIWIAHYDVHDHPEYWDSVDCAPTVRGWRFGRYKLDLFVHDFLEDSLEFVVGHDYVCFGQPPIVPPGPPPRLPLDPQDPPGRPLFDSLEVY